jgi:phage baseplate assembly protein gpV
MIRYGKICELGTGEKLGFARVNFDELDMPSGWMNLPTSGTKSFKQWISLPINTQVSVLMHKDKEQGQIIGALWSVNDTPPTWANKDTWGLQFPDDSEIYYDSVNNKLIINIANDGEILYNGGENDGLVKVNSLVTRLNNIENDINTLKGILMGWVPVPTDGGAALKTLLTASYTTLLGVTVKADIENNKIKQ